MIEGKIESFDTSLESFNDFLGTANKFIDTGNNLIKTSYDAKQLFSKSNYVFSNGNEAEGMTTSGFQLAPLSYAEKTDTTQKEERDKIIMWVVGGIAGLALLLGIGALFGGK